MKKISIIFLVCAISACGDSGGESSQPGGNRNNDPVNDLQPVESASEAISRLESTGELPRLDRGESLTGTDADDNGIRDDIDTYLSSLPVSDSEKSAIESTAGALQAIQLVDISSPATLQVSSDNLAQSVVCLSAAFDNPADAHKYLKTLEGYTANTPERAQKYIDFNTARDGSVTRLPSSSNCQ